MRRGFLLGTVLLCLCCWLESQAQIRGQLLEQGTRKPIERAIVQALSAGRIVDYVMSDAQGYFRLEKAQVPCELRVRHLSYQSLRAHIAQTTEQTYYLQPKTREIKSLVIEAPVVRQRGDTTTYYVNRYAGKADVSIEDAMKRMPGVKVDERGQISYLGKSVDKLTIDGLNLTGTNYIQATRSVRHKDVARLEVMERQQDMQYLKGVVGDDKLIMNIVLKPSGRNRIRGKAELGAGLATSRPLYGGSTTAMRLNPKAQHIATLEAGQDYIYPKYSVLWESNDGAMTSPLEELYAIPKQAVRTGLSERFHLEQRDLKTRLNAIHKFSPTATLRYGLGARHHLEKSLHGSDTHFIVPGSNGVEIRESNIATHARPDAYALWSEYLDNSSKGVVRARLSYDYDRVYYARAIERSEGESFSERHIQRMHTLQGILKMGGGNGQTLWDISMNARLLSAPKRELMVSSDALLQRLSAHKVALGLSGQLRRRIWARGRIDLPISYEVTSSILRLLSPTTPNHIQRYDYSILSGIADLRPQLSYQSKEQDYRIDVGTGLSWRHGAYRLPYGNHHYGYLNYSPFIKVFARLSHALQADLDVQATQSRGSFADYILEPIYTSYRSARKGSGCEPQHTTWVANMRMSYRRPIQELYGSLSLGYSSRQSDMLYSDAPAEQGTNIVTYILGNTKSQTWNASANVSKFFRGIKTKVDWDFQWSQSRGELYRYQRLSHYNNSTTSVQLSLAVEPLAWIDLSYKVRASLNQLRYDGATSAHNLKDFKQVAKLTLLLLEQLKCSISLEHLIREVSPDEYASFAPLGLGVEYKMGSNVLSLEADNLLNHRRYSYSVFDGLQVHSSWYQLRGRMLRMSYSFYF